MSSDLIIPNSNNKKPDILDFLDNAKNSVDSVGNSNFDIVATVKSFYGLNNHKINHQEKVIMPKNVKKQEQAKPLNFLTLSRMARMSKNSEEEIEQYQYLYDERAAIYEFEANLSRQEAQEKSLSDIQEIFANDNGLSNGDSEIQNFINYLNLTKIDND